MAVNSGRSQTGFICSPGQPYEVQEPRVFLACESLLRRYHSDVRVLANFTDFIQSIGWVLSSYNLAHNRLWPGFACDVQGFFINVGDVGSSVWSLAIAVHTVLLLAGGQRLRAWAAEKSTTGYGRWVICITIWLCNVFLAVIGPLAIQKIDTSKGPFCKPGLLIITDF